tara:strand:- start:479 stop:715 length:237 start_codon:yes stop_codon:yes gene_type:complete
MKTKWYEIEMGGKTYRTWKIKAESAKKAQEIALAEMDNDWEISGEWKRSAKIQSCNPVGGTSSMNNEEFGNYIKNNCK